MILISIPLLRHFSWGFLYLTLKGTLERPRPFASSTSMVLQAGCRKEQLKIAELKVAFEGERAKEMRIEGIRLVAL